MKRILTSVIVGAMLLTGAASVFANDSDTAVPADSLVLAEGSRYILNADSGSIDKIEQNTTVEEFKANFVGDIVIKAADGSVKSSDAIIATDDQAIAGDDTMKTIIYGDVDRNGKVNLNDVSAILKYVAMWDNVNIVTAASDVDKSDKINLNDASKILKAIAGWDDISLGNIHTVYENKAIEAPDEDDTIDVYFTDMMYKSGRTDTTHTGEYAHKMKLAKNETESCQALLLSEKNREGLSAELTSFVHEDGIAEMDSKLEWVVYLPDHAIAWPIIKDEVKGNPTWQNSEKYVNWIHGQDIPEALVSMADTFELSENAVQHLVISTTSTTDTPAGMYTAALNIMDGDKVIKTATVYAYVWDFALPDAPYSASIFANASYAYDNVTGESDGIDYYNMMLDNNMSSYILPYEITDERADAYMNDPRVSAFVIAGGGHMYGQNMYGGMMDETDEQTIANYNKVMSNPEWAKKGLFYYTDEPFGSGLQNVKTTYEYVTDLLGTTNIRNITPLAGNDSYADEQSMYNGIDPVDYIDPYINVWCPQSLAFHLSTEGGKWTPRRHLSKYGEFADRAKVFKERGEEMWWYVCCSPEIPYANYYTWYQGVVVRLLSWQQYFNDVDGILYYGISVHWSGISKYQFHIYNGDGTLAFPGEFWGRTGPSPSWRLYQIRDGFDDIDYLSIAEELVGREEVMKIVNKVTQGMLLYTEDYKVLDAARDEIVKIILENQDK